MKKNDYTVSSPNMERFRLVSIYVGNFGCFQNQTFNFCSDYTMVREPDRDGKLCLKVTYKKVLPDNFFSLSGMGKSCVDSVSAIIGANGAGKTTLARLFCNLTRHDENETENWRVVVVYESGGILMAYSTLSSEEVCVWDDERHSVKLLNGSTPWQVVYFSPYCTTEQIDWLPGDNADGVTMVSTSWLVRNPENTTFRNEGRSELQVYEGEELVRVFGFLDAYKSKVHDCGEEKKDEVCASRFGMELPKPACISISVSVPGMRHSLRQLKRSPILKLPFRERSEYKASREWSEYDAKPHSNVQYGNYSPVKDYLAGRVNSSIRSSDIMGRLFMALAMLCAVVENDDLPEQYYSELLKIITKHHGNTTTSGVSFDEIYHLQKWWNDNSYPGSRSHELDAIFNMAKCLSGLWDKHQSDRGNDATIKYDKKNGAIQCRLGDNEVASTVYWLIRENSKLSIPFLEFKPIPHMSSGQMSFVSLFARLYRFGRNNADSRPVILFLDETETTLHPEWQRRLVNYLIRFLNVFMPERRYQLIFASHSPTLLSDIPKGNCAFLRWSEKNDQYGLPINESVSFGGKDGVGGKEEGECDNTFGANIYDLYHNAFFLEHGAIGEFAEAKIHDALKAVKESATAEAVDGKKPSLDENIDKLMNLVGDRIVQRYFQRLKEFGLITGADLK